MTDWESERGWALEIQCQPCQRIIFRQEGPEAKALYFASIPFMTGHPAHEGTAREGEADRSIYHVIWFKLSDERPHLPVEVLIPAP